MRKCESKFDRYQNYKINTKYKNTNKIVLKNEFSNNVFFKEFYSVC